MSVFLSAAPPSLGQKLRSPALAVSWIAWPEGAGDVSGSVTPHCNLSRHPVMSLAVCDQPRNLAHLIWRNP